MALKIFTMGIVGTWISLMCLCGSVSVCRADTPPTSQVTSPVSHSDHGSSSDSTTNAGLTPEEQARQLQEQVLLLIQSRLDAAAVLMGQGQTKDAIAHYRLALKMEPNFAGLDGQQAALTAAADALQEQIFEAQRQAASQNIPMTDDLGTHKIALEGQLRAVQKLLQLKPAFSEAHANLAHLLAQDGAAAESLLHYQQAVRLQPALESTLRPAMIHAHLAEADRLAGLGLPEAQAEYHEALHLDPHNASAHFGLGNALLTQGKAAEAIPELKEAVRLDPDSTEAALTLGLALYQSGQRAEAREQWRHFTDSKDAHTAAEANAMLARYLLVPIQVTSPPKDAKAAEILRCRDQVRDFPNEAFAHSNLALALCNAKQMDEALQEVQIALKLDPDSVEAHTNLGRILNESEKSDAAEHEYLQALKLDSDNGATHNDLGVVYFNRQQWKRAEYEFRKALQGDHSDPYAHHNLADTLLQEGRLPESVHECSKTLEYDPTFSAAYATRGLVEDKMGDAVHGLADLQQAVHMALDPAQSLLDLVGPLRQFAPKDVAVKQYQQIMAQYPETADSENALGLLWVSVNQDQNAVTAFQAAIRLKPDLVAAHLNLARSFLRTNQLAAGAEEARTVLHLEPGSAEARNILGLSLYQSGQTQEGRQQWEAASQMDDKDAARNAANFLKEFP